MVGKAGLKAGLIGAAVMVVIALISQFLLIEILTKKPALSFISYGVNLALHAGIGVLAGLFLAPSRTAKMGAKAGAIAGLISSLLSTVVSLGVTAARMFGGASVPGLDPEQMEQLSQAGPLGFVFAGVCAVIFVALYIAAAAGGGAVLAAAKPD